MKQEGMVQNNNNKTNSINQFLETSFTELAVSFLDFHLEYPSLLSRFYT